MAWASKSVIGALLTTSLWMTFLRLCSLKCDHGCIGVVLASNALFLSCTKVRVIAAIGVY